MSIPDFAPGCLGALVGDWSMVFDAIDEGQARLIVARHINPDPVCPGCRVSLTDSEVDRLYDGRSVVCRHCGKKHRLTTGTALEGCHADFREIVIIAAMHRFGSSISDMVHVTGLSDDTVRRILRNRLGAA